MSNQRNNSNYVRRMHQRIPVLIVVLVFAGVLFSMTEAPQEKDFIVVLDAGHGGKDPGNLGTGRYNRTEKDVTLEVVTQVGAMIEKNFPNIKVVYTRRDDSFPSLKGRVEIANKNKADLFISVHCNANAKEAASGSETFVMGLHKSEESLATAMRENASIFLEDNKGQDYEGFDPNNPDTYIALSLRENVFLEQSVKLAKNVQDLFRTKLMRKDRGVKQAGYYVISFTNMPSILIELGFLTNGKEEDYLQSSDGKQRLSGNIYDAFVLYYSSTQKGKEHVRKLQESQTESSGNDVNDLGVINEESGTAIPWRDGSDGIRFKVQIHTSPTELSNSDPVFKGLLKKEWYKGGEQYKYTVGNTMSFQEAKACLYQMQKMGFKDAFIVAFEDGNRIELKQALAKGK